MSNLDEALARLNGPTTHQSDVDIVTVAVQELREALVKLADGAELALKTLDEWECRWCPMCERNMMAPHRKDCPLYAARALLARL